MRAEEVSQPKFFSSQDPSTLPNGKAIKDKSGIYWVVPNAIFHSDILQIIGVKSADVERFGWIIDGRFAR